jgi:3-oxoacyl-[acyl-carrier-protein] synthase-3
MTGAFSPAIWRDPTPLLVLGTGAALPGEAIATEALLAAVDRRFGLSLRRPGMAIANKLGIRTRHLCRDMSMRLEIPRKGNRNPELAAAAVRGALSEAGLVAQDLSYLIGHTATPARLIPPNIGQVAGLLEFDGPFVEFRQACTGLANALVFAHGLLRAGAGPVAIVGSETGSVFFDPLRAAEDAGQLVNLVQMGDGAAAIILAHDDEGTGARLSHVFYGQIGRAPGLTMADGGSDGPCCGTGFPEFRHDSIRYGAPALNCFCIAPRRRTTPEAGLLTTSFRIKPTAAWIAFWRRHSALRGSGSSLRQIGWEIQDRRPSGSPSLN